MSQEAKFQYAQIKPGDEFPMISYKLDSTIVSAYLKATEEASGLYHKEGLVPPTAVAAYAMKALSESFAIKPGTIHVSQELEFLGAINVGETITCQAKVSRKQDRGRLHLLTIDLTILNQNHNKVMMGKTSFALPE